MLTVGAADHQVGCTRCRLASVNVSTHLEHEGDKVISTRTLECTVCGYRRTWLTVRLDGAADAAGVTAGEPGQ